MLHETGLTSDQLLRASAELMSAVNAASIGADASDRPLSHATGH